jgi:diamine N-acetyltransferase
MLAIRNASTNDAQLIRELSFQVWPQTYSSILSPEQIEYMMNMMYSEAALKEQMNKGHRFIICYDDNEPVGFASYSETEPSVYKLHKIYVLTSQQGKGTGKFIIDHIIKDIIFKNASALQLNVNRHNKAKHFYEKLGFEVIAEEDIDIGNGYLMNDYIMEKKLK